MTKDLKKVITCMAVSSAILASFSGCGDSEGTDSTNSESSTNSAVEIFLDDEGNPYYTTDDGTKMLLYAYEDESDEGDEESDLVYDSFDDGNGLTFTIPDGWYADATYGYPYLFEEDDDNYSQGIAILPTNYVFTADEDGNVTEDVVKTYFDSTIEDGTYTSYEIIDTGEMEFADLEASYYEVEMSYDSDDESIVYDSKYIVTSGDNSFCILLMASFDDDSMATLDDVFDEFKDTITLPTAEQLAATEEGDDEETTVTEDDGTEIIVEAE